MAGAQFLIEVGAVDAATYERRNAAFFADYKAGRLDIRAFLDFQLRPLADNDPAQLFAWRERFLAEKIEPMLLPAAEAVVRQRLDAGDLVAVVTSTNSFVTRADRAEVSAFRASRGDGTGDDRAGASPAGSPASPVSGRAR